MTRELTGVIALTAGYTTVGAAVLYGIGLLRTVRQSLRLIGLAIIVGWVLTGIGLSLALAIGLSVSVVTTGALWAVIAVLAFLRGRVLRRSRCVRRDPSRLWWEGRSHWSERASSPST